MAILGSTGSIGTQALEVLRHRRDVEVYALSCVSSIALLQEQMAEFHPKRVVVGEVAAAQEVQQAFPGCQVDYGAAGLRDLAGDSHIDLLLSAVVGVAGLPPLVAALQQGTTVALANKEPLVAAGELVMALAKEHNATLLPVDSEHSAIFQCLQGTGAGSFEVSQIQEIILTASGGPFRERSLEELALVTPEEASRHPRWQMGAKISIDSATLVNKALEMIEASWLFSLKPEQIRVVIHPESIVHSLVALRDGSLLAQMGLPDMRLPIAYALSWPKRLPNDYPTLDWHTAFALNFYPPDPLRFTALELGRQSMLRGGTMPAVFNAANETAVELFRRRLLPFNRIVSTVEAVMLQHTPLPLKDLAVVREVTAWADRATRQFCHERGF